MSGSAPPRSGRRPTASTDVSPPRRTCCRPSRPSTVPTTTGWGTGPRFVSRYTGSPPTPRHRGHRRATPLTPIPVRASLPLSPSLVGSTRAGTSWPSTDCGATCVISVGRWDPRRFVVCAGLSTSITCACANGTTCTANCARSPRSCTWRSTAPRLPPTVFSSHCCPACSPTSVWPRFGSPRNVAANVLDLRSTSVLAVPSSPSIPDPCWRASPRNLLSPSNWWRPPGCGPGRWPPSSRSGWRRSPDRSSSVPGPLRTGQPRRPPWSPPSGRPSSGYRCGQIIASTTGA